MSPFYIEDDSELASDMGLSGTLHIQNKFQYLIDYQLKSTFFPETCQLSSGRKSWPKKERG